MNDNLLQDPELHALFIEEVTQHLQALQQALRTLYRQPAQRDALAAAQRASHTLKGTLGMVGLQQAAALAADLDADLKLALRQVQPPTQALVIHWARQVDHLMHHLQPYLEAEAPSSA